MKPETKELVNNSIGGLITALCLSGVLLLIYAFASKVFGF